MTGIKVNKNERSWAIEMISQINSIVSQNDLLIKRAGGESTISVDSKLRMFPDVILYSDSDLTSILQGWELKMPDVPITDADFVNDAQRKARFLHLDSCVIWNFQYVKFYVYNEVEDTFDVAQQWNNPHIHTRKDVADYRKEWEKTLLDVILCVNEYMKTHQLRHASFSEVISDSAIDMLINKNKSTLAGYLRKMGDTDVTINAFVEQWWQESKSEYEFDETDMYVAYAKNIILNWAYRILFAHLIKHRQNAAMLVNNIDFSVTPNEADLIFQKITAKCDFYNVFSGMDYVDLLPSAVWYSLVEFSLFLRDNGISSINQSMLQSILESTVRKTKREFNGQFTTPSVLARILVKMTVHNWLENIADPCCGTGTIPHEIIAIKGGKMGMSKAVATTWASDKYKSPLQVANLSMVSCDTINLANRLFQKDAFELKVGDIVEIVNPNTGDMMEEIIPTFGTICSNLPFVSANTMSDDDKKLVACYVDEKQLDGKSDLSYYLVLHLSKLLREGGYLGVIVSNSWLGTKAGDKFYHALTCRYDLKQVHISGRGRWFENADVVATIMILQKKSSVEQSENNTDFFVWKRNLESIAAAKILEQNIVNSALLGNVLEPSVMKMSSYSNHQISELKSLNISYNALFHDVLWLLDIKDKLVPIKRLFDVIRGSRRGWDALFFPKDNVEIEREFLKPALFNAKKITNLLVEPDRDAFCCGESLDVLESSYPNAYKWVKQFEKLTNKIGKPLTESLKIPNGEWYEMKPNEVVQFFTMMNPNKRFFFGCFREPTFINQRLIGLRPKMNMDNELYHALLNSILMKFYVEAVGFGRGLGVLDVNKASIASCYMLNPELLSEEAILMIKEKFKVVLVKEIMDVEAELKDPEWIGFNQTVLRSFGLESCYLRICNSLLSMRQVRYAAIERKQSTTIVKNIDSHKQEEFGEEYTSVPIAAETRKAN